MSIYKYKIMKTFKEFITESILDVVQPTYNVSLFDRPYEDSPSIKSEVKAQILEGLESYRNIAPILKVYVIGGILSKRYNQFSDVDVNVLFDVNNNEKDKIRKQLTKLNITFSGKNVKGTSHPINYYILTDHETFEKANNFADHVYDLLKNKFIKQTPVQNINPQDYYSDYKDAIYKLNLYKTELKNDLIDIYKLSIIPQPDLISLKSLIIQKKDEIVQDLKDIVTYSNELIKSRKEIFKKNLTPDEIVKYGRHNNLPENVIYKMLEKYYYIDLIHKLEEVLKEFPHIPYKKLMKLLRL